MANRVTPYFRSKDQAQRAKRSLAAQYPARRYEIQRPAQARFFLRGLHERGRSAATIRHSL